MSWNMKRDKVLLLMSEVTLPSFRLLQQVSCEHIQSQAMFDFVPDTTKHVRNEIVAAAA